MFIIFGILNVFLIYFYYKLIDYQRDKEVDFIHDIKTDRYEYKTEEAKDFAIKSLKNTHSLVKIFFKLVIAILSFLTIASLLNYIV